MFELGEITVEAGNPVYYTVDGVLFEKLSDGGVCLVLYPSLKAETTYTVPNGVTQLSKFAFDCAYNLEDIYYPDSVKNPMLITLTGKCGANVSYAFNTKKGVLAISGSGAMDKYEYSFNTPWEKQMSENHRSYSVRSLVIGAGVTDVSGIDSMFGLEEIIVEEGNPLYYTVDGVLFKKPGNVILVKYPAEKEGSSYTIPKGVTRIGKGAFQGAYKLKDISFSRDVEYIDEKAFFSCDFVTVELPNKLKSIGENAFAYNDSLQYIVIPTNVGGIDAWAFSYCPKLKRVNFAGTSTNLSGNYYDAFEGCAEDLVIICREGSKADQYAKSAGRNVLYYSSSGSNKSTAEFTYHVNNWGVATVTGYTGSSANVVIPETLGGYPVCSITGQVFANSNVESVTIPNTIVDIELYTLEGIENIYISAENPKYSDKDGVLFNKDGTELIRFAKSGHYTVPNGVKIIDSDAFSGCTGLTSISIPASVTDIYFTAFWDCSNLKEIKVDDANTAYCSVDGVLFNKDKTLLQAYPRNGKQHYAIPKGVQRVSRQAFGGSNLVSLVIPDGDIYIEEDAIACGKLTCLTVYSKTARFEENKAGHYVGGAPGCVVLCYKGSTADERLSEDEDASYVLKYIPSRPNGIVMQIDSPLAIVRDNIVYNDVSPIIVNNRTMLPARFVAENLGATVEWNGAESKVTIKGNGTTIEFVINNKTAYVNGKAVTLDSPAFISNDRTYTPVRFIAEALGATVEWDGTARQAILTAAK